MHPPYVTDQQKVLENAAKGQTARQQINTREQLKGLQKQIDANNKLGEARLKALDAAKQEGDVARQIAKAQAAYQAALAKGDTASAQQFSLDIQGLQSDQQYNSQKQAIENSIKLSNAPLEAKIKLINDGQQKLSDNAAIAAGELDKLNKKIAIERQKIDDVNQSMTTLRINAAALNMTVKEYQKTVEGQQDSARLVKDVNTAVPGTIVTPKPALQLKRSPRVEERTPSVVDQAAGFMGGVEGAVAKGLASKGIQMGSGDIIINGKKMDVGPSKSTGKIGFVPTTLGQSAGAYAGSTFIQPTQLQAAGIQMQSGPNGRATTWVGTEFTDKNGKKWKVTGDGGRMGLSIQAVKAGYGTMKLNPKVPTIVGDRGPEMAFGGMIIPNMAKVPYASPRYDVRQAEKMFEPMKNSSGGQGVINYTQVINASPGMNEDQLITKAKIAAYEFLQSSIKSNAKMVGTSMNVSIKKT